MLYGIPRSSRWLVTKNRTDEALDGTEDDGLSRLEAELREIMDSVHLERGMAAEPLFIREYRLPIFLAVTIGLFNQLSGINAILYYSNYIFASAGFSQLSGSLQTVLDRAHESARHLARHEPHRQAGPQNAAADRQRRNRGLPLRSRRHLLTPTPIRSPGLAAGRLHCLLLHLARRGHLGLYRRGVPNRVRSKGQSLGSSSHWIMNALISLLFPILAKYSGGMPFVFFAAMMALQFFVVLFFYPETKGITLEQLQHKLGIA